MSQPEITEAAENTEAPAIQLKKKVSLTSSVTVKKFSEILELPVAVVM